MKQASASRLPGRAAQGSTHVPLALEDKCEGFPRLGAAQRDRGRLS